MSRRAPTAASAIGAATLLLAGAGVDGDALALARITVLGAALGQVVVVDLRERRIPNRIVLPAACVCALLSILDRQRVSGGLVLGASSVAVLLAVSLLRPAALGMGDVKLALLILCGLGTAAPRAFLLALELYTLAGALLLIRRGRSALGSSLPLAPMIAAGSAIALLL